MKRAARNVDNYLSTASLKFFIINRYESDLVLPDILAYWSASSLSGNSI